MTSDPDLTDSVTLVGFRKFFNWHITSRMHGEATVNQLTVTDARTD